MMSEAPAVFNVRSGQVPDDAIYIGRGSKWGNPFRIGEMYNINGTHFDNASREEVIKLYVYWFPAHLRASLPELVGKNLVCYCAPLPCHGDWLHQEAINLS